MFILWRSRPQNVQGNPRPNATPPKYIAVRRAGNANQANGYDDSGALIGFKTRFWD